MEEIVLLWVVRHWHKLSREVVADPFLKCLRPYHPVTFSCVYQEGETNALENLEELSPLMLLTLICVR